MDELAELSFEEAFRALEEAVRELEEGDLKLEEAIAVYQQGMRLAQRCSAALDQAEVRVQQIGPGAGQQMGMFFDEAG